MPNSYQHKTPPAINGQIDKTAPKINLLAYLQTSYIGPVSLEAIFDMYADTVEHNKIRLWVLPTVGKAKLRDGGPASGPDRACW